ncbi:MAG: hypothetical protein EXR62_08140 [Chloroflexi bacterium]|nr:hypothetical protein [Chloroflexota bacterium]
MTLPEPKTIKVPPDSELGRLLEEAEDAPIILDKDGVLFHLGKVKSKKARRHRRTEADHAAFLASAGGWKDLVDTEKLKVDIYESRRISSRPPVEL